MMVPERSFTGVPLPDVSGEAEAAERLTGAGVLYPVSARQDDTRQLVESPPGYQEFTITGGFTGDWPADVAPHGDPGNGGYGGA
jgi:hypothetical protein